MLDPNVPLNYCFAHAMGKKRKETEYILPIMTFNEDQKCLCLLWVHKTGEQKGRPLLTWEATLTALQMQDAANASARRWLGLCPKSHNKQRGLQKSL